jgi:hypothetical protein
MPTEIKDIIDLNIGVEASRITRAGFGTLLLLANTAAVTTRVASYSNLSEMITAGYATTDDAYIAVQNIFSQALSPAVVKIGEQITADASDWTTTYAAVKVEDPDFYAVALLDATKADIEAISPVVEAEKRIFFAVTADADVAAGTASNVAENLANADRDRTSLIYSTDADGWANAVWAGRMLPETPGSANWAYTELKGIDAETLTTTELGNLADNNCNRIETISGVKSVPAATPGKVGGAYGGIVSSGEFLDTIRGVDFLEARLSEDLFSLLIQQKKVPFTNDGLAMVESVLRKGLELYGVQNNILVADSITITLPDLSTYDSTKKAQRWLDGVTFTADLAGAINKISISGTVSV